MRFGRYKDRNWNHCYERSCRCLGSMLRGHAPKVLIEREARMLLQACYGGPWRAIVALVKAELKSLLRAYGWSKWEWIRTRIFRRPQCEALAAYERDEAEDNEVEKMLNDL